MENISIFSPESIIFPNLNFESSLSDIIGSKIRLCISQVFIYGEPEIVQIDNGTEFRNKDVIGYLKVKDLKCIHGMPNHPKSQNAAEDLTKLYKTIFQNFTKMIR